MTREEAIAYFKRHIDLYCVTGICREAEEMAIQALEQQSSGSEIPNNCEMRDATLEERESIDKYIKSISKPTGVKFGALEQEPCEDCRNCKKWDNCECGRKGHINGTSIGYSIGECKDYEPCEDAISREAVLEKAVYTETEEGWWGYTVDVDYIKSLPSIKPQERTGHWIIIDDCEKFIAKCSECGRIEDSRMISKYPYCHCGAKMEVEQHG